MRFMLGMQKKKKSKQKNKGGNRQKNETQGLSVRIIVPVMQCVLQRGRGASSHPHP